MQLWSVATLWRLTCWSTRFRRDNLYEALRGDAKHCALAMVTRSQRFSPRRRLPSRRRGTAKI